jgi:hypothetical protein
MGPLGDEGAHPPGGVVPSSQSLCGIAPVVHGKKASMSSWVPPLSVRETGHGCRLSLGGIAVGHGRSLQEAADQLVGRVLDAALAVRTGGVSFTPALPADPRLIEFLAEVAELSARGGDVRRRVLG